MAATVPSFQHGRPWPIDNMSAPKSLEFKNQPTINTKPQATPTKTEKIENPRTADDFMTNFRIDLSGVN